MNFIFAMNDEERRNVDNGTMFPFNISLPPNERYKMHQSFEKFLNFTPNQSLGQFDPTSFSGVAVPVLDPVLDLSSKFQAHKRNRSEKRKPNNDATLSYNWSLNLPPSERHQMHHSFEKLINSVPDEHLPQFNEIASNPPDLDSNSQPHFHSINTENVKMKVEVKMEEEGEEDVEVKVEKEEGEEGEEEELEEDFVATGLLDCYEPSSLNNEISKSSIVRPTTSSIDWKMAKARRKVDDSIALDVNDSTDEEPSDEEVLYFDPLSKLLTCNDYENAPDDGDREENEDDDNEDESPRQWSRRANDAIPLRPFTLATGPRAEYFVHCKTPTDVFLKFFDPELIAYIGFQTQLYASQTGKNGPPITEEELYTFLGLNIYMGYARLPSWNLYWSQCLDLKMEFVSGSMTRDRFAYILSNLHLNDNSKLAGGSSKKLYKLEPMLNKLNENFLILYNPRRELSIDGIVFRGRSCVESRDLNTLKKNPATNGYKLWCLGDSTGYISRFEVCTEGERENYGGDDYRDRNRYELGGKVVLRMARRFLKKGYILFFDRYLSSVALVERLRLENTYACATIHPSSKHFPHELRSGGSSFIPQTGDSEWMSNEKGVTVYKWVDSEAEVFFISNYHGSRMTTVKRRDESGTDTAVACPDVVSDYSLYMGGIDKHDVQRQLYEVHTKGRKWWHRIFFGLLDMTVVNAFVVYKLLGLDESLTLLEFRRMLSMGLVTKGKGMTMNHVGGGCSSSSSSSSNNNKRKKSGYSVAADIRLTNKGVHWPKFVPSRGRCEVCAKQKIESRPASTCSMCNVHLCINASKNCFVKYHQD